MWKERDSDLFVVTSGGWPSWSHLMHRMIHDDLEERSRLDIKNIADIDACAVMIRKLRQKNFQDILEGKANGKHDTTSRDKREFMVRKDRSSS